MAHYDLCHHPDCEAWLWLDRSQTADRLSKELNAFSKCLILTACICRLAPVNPSSCFTVRFVADPKMPPIPEKKLPGGPIACPLKSPSLITSTPPLRAYLVGVALHLIWSTSIWLRTLQILALSDTVLQAADLLRFKIGQFLSFNIQSQKSIFAPRSTARKNCSFSGVVGSL